MQIMTNPKVKAPTITAFEASPAGLLPLEANARARAITWMFAALSTVEPPILERETATIQEGDEPWTKQRMHLVVDRAHHESTAIRCMCAIAQT